MLSLAVGPGIGDHGPDDRHEIIPSGGEVDELQLLEPDVLAGEVELSDGLLQGQLLLALDRSDLLSGVLRRCGRWGLVLLLDFLPLGGRGWCGRLVGGLHGGLASLLASGGNRGGLRQHLFLLVLGGFVVLIVRHGLLRRVHLVGQPFALVSEQVLHVPLEVSVGFGACPLDVVL